MNRIKISEEAQRNLFIEWYMNDSEPLFCEIPVFTRSVDLVKYNIDKNEITAIEFKLNDWKKAIEQALSVDICFDYLEICIPLPKRKSTYNTVLDECKQHGVGVYFFNQEAMTFERAVEPKSVSNIWDVQKKNILNYLGGLKNE